MICRIIFSDDFPEGFNFEDIKAVAEKAIIGAVEYEKTELDVCISVTFTDNEEIRILNSEFRGIDKPTDVLSFPTYDLFEKEACFGEYVELGDIVISLERALSQAEEYNHSLSREVAFLCVHSVLHLLGYDHETSSEDERIMFERQNEIMEYIGIGRDQ